MIPDSIWEEEIVTCELNTMNMWLLFTHASLDVRRFQEEPKLSVIQVYNSYSEMHLGV